MKTITKITEMRNYVKERQRNGDTIGFVPTMGYLHAGHRALIKQAKQHNDVVIVSVFVNPLQFNQSSDLESYPRDFERDANILKQDGVEAVFYPDVDEMYPEDQSIELNVVRRTDVLCGKSRPGHFEGVVTVLSKLFNIIQPNQVYFGSKDAQQVAVVDALIQDLNFDIQLNPVSTVREADGLALSSRNVNLESFEREEAHHLFKSLLKGQDYIKSNQSWERSVVIDIIKKYLNEHTTGKIDYVDCLSFPNLNENIDPNHDIIIAVAIYYKKARLIDNLIMDSTGLIKYGSE
ncbi:pantoate--beta-alanine ligase [Piscibacillus halophilus]|uniref:Pantothenate synthetase n=1 Tax=Piscibacillus halophilus TaxID=571933 RepID=A0A1H8ZRD7_9BACI|nr:pantoate--beta-alanine ligase [Piscibacillus halophilus]SEP67030.1 pantothenate synthetase [Piscibacillus halophilus]